jgi:hypothetical protein
MAKTEKSGSSAAGQDKAADSRVEAFAEDLGRLLGTAQSKAEGWLGQRKEIVKHLSDIRDTAARLLTDLGHQAERAVRRGRPSGSKNKPAAPVEHAAQPISRKKRRKMSAEARERIAEAQRKRWAAKKAAEKKHG